MSRAAEEGDLSGLLARCRKGDSRAWRELVDRFQSFVYSIPRRMGLSEEDAADVFQTTFIALHRSLDRLETAEALPKWLAVTAAREAARTRRLGTRIPVAARSDDDRPLDEVIAAEERTAEEESIAACEADLVRRAVQSMSGRCADLLGALYLEEERAYQEIADRLGMPIGAIGPTRARCLEKLRQMLVKEGFFV